MLIEQFSQSIKIHTILPEFQNLRIHEIKIGKFRLNSDATYLPVPNFVPT